MAIEITLDIDDHSAEVLKALKNAVHRGLKSIGTNAVSHAREYVTHEHRIDTGNMRRSITHNENSVGSVLYTMVGTDVYYAVYQELGTSTGIKPAYFLTRAARDHTDEYRDLMMESIENA